jgi:pyocin large subunit-like protein
MLLLWGILILLIPHNIATASKMTEENQHRTRRCNFTVNCPAAASSYSPGIFFPSDTGTESTPTSIKFTMDEPDSLVGGQNAAEVKEIIPRTFASAKEKHDYENFRKIVQENQRRFAACRARRMATPVQNPLYDGPSTLMTIAPSK